MAAKKIRASMDEVSNQDEMKIDIISGLHDSVLIHILSLMNNTKEVVQTCLLSKRWRNLWAFVPSLDFHRHDFESLEFFKQFVNAVLLLRKTSNLDAFVLNWENDSALIYHLGAINVWIQHVLALKPRVLLMNCEFYDTSNLPLSLFSCDSLEDLTLVFSYYGNINPVLINLPNLKKLKLGFITINDEFLKKLLSLCPLLGELELFKCSLHISEISSNRLKRLYLEGFYNSNMITINIPSLKRLHLCGDFTFGFWLKNMASLYRANLSLSSCPSFNSEILSGLSNVTELVLTGAPLKVMLKRELLKCPKFNNLMELMLDESFEDNEFDMEAIFLANSPNLEDENIYVPAEDDDNDDEE
ncbi:hypothetical protein LUZ60_005500 [Juncus effusus]|nr:hypothetical protein LUZ60_005500 [Juncus effusus]